MSSDELQREREIAAQRLQDARRTESMPTGRKAIWITFVVSAVGFGAANLSADAGGAPGWLGPALNVPLALSFLCLVGGVGKR